MGKKNYLGKYFEIYLDGEKYWELLETGQSTDLIYPEHFKVEVIKEKYEEEIVKYLDEGEEYRFIDEDYVITSKGRVFNCKHKRFRHLNKNQSQTLINLRYKTIKVEEEMKKYGW